MSPILNPGDADDSAEQTPTDANGDTSPKRGSTLSVATSQRAMSKVASRGSTYSVLDDKKRWAIFLQGGETLVMTGLAGKPNPMGIHLIRQLVLTSRKRLLYIDPKTMECKGEIAWTSSLAAAYPQCKKVRTCGYSCIFCCVMMF